MTITILGKQDAIALPKLRPDISLFGFRSSYSKPTYDRCYSKYGFAVPLNLKGVPYSCWMEGFVPKSTEHVKRDNDRFAYLLIDANAFMWNVSIYPNDKNEVVFDQSFIDYKMGEGWWHTDDFDFTNLDEQKDCNMLTGFLYTDPTQEKVDEFFFENKGFAKLEWMSVDAIVQRIRKNNPELEPL